MLRVFFCRRATTLALLLATLFASPPGVEPAHAQSADAAREQRRQEERTDALRRQQERAADVRRPALPAADVTRLPADETPCFAIRRVEIAGDDKHEFAWLAAAAAGPDGKDPPQDRCLGTQGINLILKRLQNALIARGYITSRVAAQAQDLKTGVFVVSLTPGRIRNIAYAPDTAAGSLLPASVPARPGDLLNLRDIEQGLENYKRVPTADTDIKILPGEEPGQSDVVIARRQAFPLRATLTADDAGTKATGKYQGSVAVAWDNPARLNDLLYAYYSHDLGGQGGGRGTQGGGVHYSAPVGYWLVSAGYDRSRHYQTIAGAYQDYVYRGSRSNAEIRLQRTIQRDGNSKTSVSLAAFRRRSDNFINDTEVEVQRRRTGGWQAAVAHRRYFGSATLDAGVSHKRGTGAFGAIAAPEQAFGEGTSRFALTTAELTLNVPFTLAGRSLRYQGNWRGQANHTRLTPEDQFLLGGRYTVRGFDGEMILLAERGWLLRNDLGLALGGEGTEAYVGMDYGEVAGPSSDLLLGKRLAGAVVGVRGSFKGLGYDVFAGTPIKKPAGFATAGTTAGFNLNYGF